MLSMSPLVLSVTLTVTLKLRWYRSRMTGNPSCALGLMHAITTLPGRHQPAHEDRLS
jgi:hypothetical protein